jgi:hypothetical protein
MIKKITEIMVSINVALGIFFVVLVALKTIGTI